MSLPVLLALAAECDCTVLERTIQRWPGLDARAELRAACSIASKLELAPSAATLAQASAEQDERTEQVLQVCTALLGSAVKGGEIEGDVAGDALRLAEACARLLASADSSGSDGNEDEPAPARGRLLDAARRALVSVAQRCSGECFGGVAGACEAGVRAAGRGASPFFDAACEALQEGPEGEAAASLAAALLASFLDALRVPGRGLPPSRRRLLASLAPLALTRAGPRRPKLQEEAARAAAEALRDPAAERRADGLALALALLRAPAADGLPPVPVDIGPLLGALLDEDATCRKLALAALRLCPAPGGALGPESWAELLLAAGAVLEEEAIHLIEPALARAAPLLAARPAAEALIGAALRHENPVVRRLGARLLLAGEAPVDVSPAFALSHVLRASLRGELAGHAEGPS
eukprot:tig00001339_g8256.t1